MRGRKIKKTGKAEKDSGKNSQSQKNIQQRTGQSNEFRQNSFQEVD